MLSGCSHWSETAIGGTLGTMPGQPMLREISRYIEQQGGDAWVLDQIADGVNVQRVADQIKLRDGTTPSRQMLYTWRNKSDERREGWDLAMKAAGDAHADKAGDVLEELADNGPLITAQEVNLAGKRSDYHRWMAGIRNRERYGDQKQAPLQLNIAELHLTALKQAGNPTALMPASVPEAEIEILEDEDG